MGAMVHRRPLTGALENGLHLYLHYRVSDCMVMSVLQGLSIDRSEVQTLQGRHLFRDFSSTCNTYYITNSAKLNTLTVLYRWEDETAGTGLMRRI